MASKIEAGAIERQTRRLQSVIKRLIEGERLIMRVPADVEHDMDLIIAASVDLHNKQAAALTALQSTHAAALARAEAAEAAIRAFFAAPTPPGRYVITSGVMVVGLAAVAALEAALASDAPKGGDA